jgi:hypothetical protein
LRFVLADFPRLGSVCRIHTSSYRSIRQIHSALQEIQTFTGGRLAGITGKLVVRPEEVAYFDRKETRKKDCGSDSGSGFPPFGKLRASFSRE